MAQPRRPIKGTQAPPTPVMTSVLSPDASLIQFIADQSARVPVPVSVLILAFAGIAWGRVPKDFIGIWLAFAFVVMIIRLYGLRRLPSATVYTPKQKVLLAVALSAVNGISHGLVLIAFPALTDVERAYFTVLIMGLCVGAVGTTAGHRALYVAYLVPTMLPLTILWWWYPSNAQPDMAHRALALLPGLFIWILLGLAKNTHSAFVESYRIRFQEHQMNARLQVALDAARDASHAKTRFLAAASHDLRQPLQSLSLLVATLSMRQLDERSARLVQLAEQANASLAELMDSLLDISKLDAGIVHANLHPTPLQSLLENHCHQLSNGAHAKGLTLNWVSGADLLGNTDPQLLMRVVRNLTDNAIKFTETGHISISLNKRDNYACIAVEDTGIGIEVSQQEKIYHEFYQIDNPERDRSKGLGLGLSIVQRLCDLLQAKLTMASEPGVGTRFEIWIPLAVDLRSSPRAKESAPSSTFRLQVLIVDDDERVRGSMQELLLEMGCLCEAAASTTQAMDIARSFCPDIMLADYRLTGDDDGIKAVRAVRTLWPDVPALLISGDTAPDRLRDAERAGIRLLHKPLHIDALKAELAQVQLT